LYKYLSGYGEQVITPLFWAAIVLVLRSYGLLYCGIATATDKQVPLGISDGLQVFLFSFRNMALLRPDTLIPLSMTGQVVATLQNLVGPLLFGLCALAVRQKLKR